LGWEHQRERAAALAALAEGTLCELCGRPMYLAQKLDLDHVTPRAAGGEGRRRLTHAGCNRSRGARWGNRRRRRVAEVRRADLPVW
jgi:5-methylcytosine-specific restriction endonuclease McrA